MASYRIFHPSEVVKGEYVPRRCLADFSLLPAIPFETRCGYSGYWRFLIILGGQYLLVNQANHLETHLKNIQGNSQKIVNKSLFQRYKLLHSLEVVQGLVRVEGMLSLAEKPLELGRLASGLFFSLALLGLIAH